MTVCTEVDQVVPVFNTKSSCGIEYGNDLADLRAHGHVVDGGRAEHVETPLYDIHSSPIDACLPSKTFPFDCEFQNPKKL